MLPKAVHIMYVLVEVSEYRGAVSSQLTPVSGRVSISHPRAGFICVVCSAPLITKVKKSREAGLEGTRGTRRDLEGATIRRGNVERLKRAWVGASQQSLPEEEKEEVALELSKVPAAEVEIVGPVLVRSKWEELGRKAAGASGEPPASPVLSSMRPKATR